MDTSLAARVRRGDRAAFDEMVREHYLDLLDFAHALLRQRAMAEDVVQDVLLNVWERHAEWNPRVSARAYFFAAVRNRAYNARRSAATSFHLANVETDVASQHAADEHAIYEDLLRRYLRAISELPDRRREVFRLSRLYGLTYDEIAVVLGISTHTVRSQISSALKHLRDRLTDHLYMFL